MSRKKNKSKTTQESERPPSSQKAQLDVEEKRTFSGTALKKARENRGTTLEDIFKRTRIRIGTLSALEEERFEDVPNAQVYVRGFVRCFAQELDLDPDLVWRDYKPRWENWQRQGDT